MTNLFPHMKFLSTAYESLNYLWMLFSQRERQREGEVNGGDYFVVRGWQQKRNWILNYSCYFRSYCRFSCPIPKLLRYISTMSLRVIGVEKISENSFSMHSMKISMLPCWEVELRVHSMCFYPYQGINYFFVIDEVNF